MDVMSPRATSYHTACNYTTTHDGETIYYEVHQQRNNCSNNAGDEIVDDEDDLASPVGAGGVDECIHTFIRIRVQTYMILHRELTSLCQHARAFETSIRMHSF